MTGTRHARTPILPNAGVIYEKMVKEADWMVEAMRDGRTDQDVISEVTGFMEIVLRGRCAGLRGRWSAGGRFS